MAFNEYMSINILFLDNFPPYYINKGLFMKIREFELRFCVGGSIGNVIKAG